MSERKPISKKLRFEVFKRDKFTCQYCGRKAPDVILEIEHVKPVVAGGTNDMLNLVAACEGCNDGKGARLLSDTAVVDRQRSQLESLQERREQINMLLEWQQELSETEGNVIDAVCAHANKILAGSHVVDADGKKTIQKWTQDYSLADIFDSLSRASARVAPVDLFKYTSGILRNINKSKDNPHLKDAYYVRKIAREELRNNGSDDPDLIPTICRALEDGYTVSDLRSVIKNGGCYNQYYFIQKLKERLDG